MKPKKLLSFVTATAILSTLISAGTVHAATKEDVIKHLNDSSKIEVLAKNAFRTVNQYKSDKWTSIKVVNQKNLYDFDGKLVAYSIDVQNGETGAKGYIILSSNKENEPILESAIGTYSPYTELTSKLNNKTDITYIYSGILSYSIKYTDKNASNRNFAKTTSNYKYFDLRDNKDIDNTIVKSMTEEAKAKEHKSKNITSAQKTWDMLSGENAKEENITPNYNPLISSKIKNNSSYLYHKVISGVPDYTWYRGCAPTAAANVLAYYHHSGVPTGNTLIDELAAAMNTDSKGGTSISNERPGIKQVAANHGWKLAIFTDPRGKGEDESPYGDFRDEIDESHPLFCSLQNSRYGDGHAVTGVGYEYQGTDYEYVIIHDTWSSTPVDVAINYNSSDIGSPSWMRIHSKN
jgi:hypothetical protein